MPERQSTVNPPTDNWQPLSTNRQPLTVMPRFLASACSTTIGGRMSPASMWATTSEICACLKYTLFYITGVDEAWRCARYGGARERPPEA